MRDRNSGSRLGGQESLLPHMISLVLKQIATRNEARTEPRPPPVEIRVYARGFYLRGRAQRRR